MEAEGRKATHLPHTLHGVFPALSAALFISMGYIDPGKWAACIDSGARFGGDLAVFLFLFNLVAILCQYLSVHIAVVSGKSLAQICNVEYDKFNCIFLGIQAEVSIVMSDLAMILGIANGLHMMLRMDLFSAVFLAALDAILYPLFSTLLANSKANGVVVHLAGLTFLCCVLGMLLSLPENSISPIAVPSKIIGENAYALMSLLGASIIPHNLYLHSSIVQRFQGSPGEARARQAYDNFFSIFSIFSIIFFVNYVLMNSAANIFYSAGLILLTFQDAMSLMEQSLWSPTRPLAFLLLFSSSHISGLSWEISGEGRQTVLYDLFGIDLPGWLHRVTVRIFAIIPALYCLWYSGPEGMYQMLISTQIMAALLLPASVVALYRIASSGELMGPNKISPVIEFFMMMSFMAMIGLQLIFLGEMVFGDSAWLEYLSWNMGTASISSPYVILIFSGCASLCFTCRIFVTPLRSADERSKAQQWRRYRSRGVRDSLDGRQENCIAGSVCDGEQFNEREKTELSSEKAVELHSDAPAPDYVADLPETILETYQEIEEVSAVTESTISSVGSLEQATILPESITAPVPEVIDDWSDTQSVASSESRVGASDLVEKILRVEGESEEASKEVPELPPVVAPEGLRNHSGRLDEVGSGAGSLSRLSGLGRAARRQLAAILDEFWGQLYNYHGQLTQEAISKKLDLLVGVDSNSKPPPSLARADYVGQDFGSRLQSVRAAGSDSLRNSNLYDASIQQRLPSSAINSAYSNAFDNSEKRYSSLRLPPSSEAMNYQPATLHGYQFPSYLNRTTKDNLAADYMNVQREYTTMKTTSPSLGVYNLRDPLAFGLSLSPKPTNGYSSAQISAFQNLPESRNSMLHSDGSNYELFSPIHAEIVANEENPKKYHSLPGFATLVGRTTAGRPLHANLASRVAPPGFDDFSKTLNPIPFPSRSISGLDAGSLWHRQPFEQFGVANNSNKTFFGVEGGGQKSVGLVEPATSVVDSEVNLLLSMKHCIMKLLKLEGSEWLFRQTDGVDEDLVERVAAREKFLYEADFKDLGKLNSLNSASKTDVKNVISSVPQCGEGCVWKAELIVSFGVWCIHRILELSLMESRPELWGKYTYVLNRLQGVIDLAFNKQRNPVFPCFCLQIAAAYQQRLHPVPTARPPHGKFTTGPMLVEIIKDVELAISSRKGRSGTTAGDVAFPKGKENLASVLKRYKRRLSTKPVGYNGLSS